jgi:hypothetical protein
LKKAAFPQSHMTNIQIVQFAPFLQNPWTGPGLYLHVEISDEVTELMTLLTKVHDPQKELIRNYRLLLKEGIKSFRNSHVRRYISSCFDQAVAFTEMYYASPHEISPLLGFYALLNLTKVHVLAKSPGRNPTIADVGKMFSSHGASSLTVEKVRIGAKGTFVELAKLYHPGYNRLAEVTLNWLYQNLTDLHDLYLRIYKNSGSPYVRTGFASDILRGLYSDADPENRVGLFFEPADDLKAKQALGTEWQYTNLAGKLCAFIPVDPASKSVAYFNLLRFSIDNEIFVCSDSTPNEIVVLYLLFLKFSSLVRYQPKNWSEKLESKEFSIIDKIKEIGVLKYWTLLHTDLAKVETYIV